jgi:hypothetical protein
MNYQPKLSNEQLEGSTIEIPTPLRSENKVSPKLLSVLSDPKMKMKVILSNLLSPLIASNPSLSQNWEITNNKTSIYPSAITFPLSFWRKKFNTTAVLIARMRCFFIGPGVPDLVKLCIQWKDNQLWECILREGQSWWWEQIHRSGNNNKIKDLGIYFIAQIVEVLKQTNHSYCNRSGRCPKTWDSRGYLHSNGRNLCKKRENCLPNKTKLRQGYAVLIFY